MPKSRRTSGTSGRFWDKQTDEHILLLVVISWGLWFSVGVDAWTYHYGDKSDLIWEEARRFCKTYYTDLVAIQNQKEIDHLNEFVPFYPKYYWIGIRKINNTWTWVGTNKILTKEAENWAYREPNNKRANQDCVEIYIKRDREPGKWNDEPCTKRKRSLCYKASCYHSSCNEQGECVETIGNYTCQCYPGFFGPECEHVVKCRHLGAIHRPMHMSCNHPLSDFSYRSSCAFSCEEGFELSGHDTLQCLPSGNWTAEIPQCVAVQCKPLNTPTHGDFSCSHMYGDFQYQSTCNFKCAEGFVLSGTETTVCEKSGEWSSLVPACQVKQCQEIEQPRRGTMDCVNPIGDFAYNTTCDFSCEAGFQLSGSKTLHCSTTGTWSSHVPLCQAVQCQPLQAPTHGNSTCFHIHGDFQYQSNCTFRCSVGFLLHGEEMIWCTAQGEWSSAVPVCQAIECPKLSAPKDGELKCSHRYGNFTYDSTCAFSCNRGFVQIGTKEVQCTALGTWTEKPPLCEAIQCHSLQRPENGRMICSHPVGVFAFNSTCEFACEPGFTLTGTKATHCLATGNWSAPVPICQAVKCPALHEPDNGHFSCLHPHSNSAYGSSCNFSCTAGFHLVGSRVLDCLAGGNWTEPLPHCKAIQCSALEMPENGKGNCSHPHGQFAYNSSCIFSCNSGFELVGAQKLECMDQGNWTGDMPICKAIQCSALEMPENGKGNCSHPHGQFAYNSSCIFFCNSGFELVGAQKLECMDQGNWTGDVPICKVKRCPQLRNKENTRMNCSNPLDSFSYRSACRFHCAEGYILNGTSTMQCQLDGQWSAEMPFCQETVAPFLKQVLLYTGGVAASVVALALSGGLIVLIVKRLSRRGERKKLLSHTSDLGVPGVFSNAAFDSGS